MTEGPLTAVQGFYLVRLARETIGHRLGVYAEINRQGLDERVMKLPLSTFVTLKIEGKLRGCIGNLEPSGSVVESVSRNALSAAFHDYRFPPLQDDELSTVHIDVSVLTPARPLTYEDEDDLVDRLRPGIDGVILQFGRERATFLPQVWEQLPDVELFLDHLSIKAGRDRSAWRHQKPEVYVYQVQSFAEQKS